MDDMIKRIKREIRNYFLNVLNESKNDVFTKEDLNILTHNKNIQKIINGEVAKKENNKKSNSELPRG